MKVTSALLRASRRERLRETARTRTEINLVGLSREGAVCQIGLNGSSHLGARAPSSSSSS